MKFYEKLMKKIVFWLDQKFVRFRPQKTPSQPTYYTPHSTEDLINILRRTPKTILGKTERAIIASAMSFKITRVRDIMADASEIIYVPEDEILGPLTLDKLYKSGFSHFPVQNKKGEIVGVIHTESLNNLEIKKAEPAKKFLDKHLYFVKDTYSLEQAFATLLRTNAFFLIVLDKTDQIVGILTCEILINFILGYIPSDNFIRDNDRSAVSNRA